MRKLGLVIAFYIFVSTFFASVTLLPEGVVAPTIYVGGSGPGNYSTIQEGIDNAGANTTVYVFSGTYSEHVNVHKPVSLVGENRDTTIIDGGGTGVVVDIHADWVELRGFTVTGSGSAGYNAGIYLNGVSACSFHDNAIVDNGGDGIYLYYSSGNAFVHNNISRNNWSGITDDWLGGGNTITDNTILDNGAAGIYIPISGGDFVSSNEVSGSYYGISVYNTGSNVIFNNTVSSNVFGIHLQWAGGNLIYHNRLLNNSVQAYDDGSFNDWDNGYPSGGNYWSEYAGVDQMSGPNQDQPGGDGIGDFPYVIDSDSRDNYPLMHPFPIPPSLEPSNLDSHLSGKGLENVTLTWDLSGDDGAGRDDIVEYSIFRGTAYHPSGLGYVLHANVTNGTSIYVDSFAGEGDPSGYAYRLCAVNIQGISSCADNQAAKFTRPLTTGSSLVSIPLIQSNESIETVLQTVEYDKAWFYDSSSGEWKWYMKNKGYRRGLFNINHTMGIWINVTKDSNLTVAGIVPAQTTIHLYEGWNLVSFPSFNSSYTVYDLAIDTGAVRVEGYDPAPPYHLRVLGDAEVLLTGEAYWMRVVADTDWIVEVS